MLALILTGCNPVARESDVAEVQDQASVANANARSALGDTADLRDRIAEQQRQIEALQAQNAQQANAIEWLVNDSRRLDGDLSTLRDGYNEHLVYYHNVRR